MIRGTPLDGKGNDLPSPAVGLFPGLGFDLLDQLEGVGARLLLNLPQELLARLLGGQSGHPLQLLLVAGLLRLGLVTGPGEILLFLGQGSFPVL
ncbi:MAG: hypothetical protein AUI83_24230 [Armatimonadetes bacterium 13_1_40CM_3_65_7]|nr:MAG: hypothetical protein AUI83_24230 [Armatimonadetes bacterium 13_1_40CM_3_65_7]